jgi:hypothetical protein
LLQCSTGAILKSSDSHNIPPERPENPLERIAREGFDRGETPTTPPPPPFATVAIAKKRGIEVSPEVAGSLTLLGTVVTSYLKPLTYRELQR